MLVDEEYVIEEIDIAEGGFSFGGDVPGVHLRYHQTEPGLIRDGINSVAVIQESGKVYRIDYGGYLYGRLRVTTDGIEQLGQKMLCNPDTIPNWTLDPETVNAEDLPWWVPDETSVAPTVTCEDCRSDVSVQEAVTPRRSRATGDSHVFCRDCWQKYR